MKKRHQLFHPVFVIALALLLLNDFYLKWEYTSWWTGKLSDFCGLYVFVIFFFSIFKNYRKLIVIATTLIFIWWKSPWSESFIELWNSLAPFSIDRVVDFTDLYALVVLALAYFFPLKPIKIQVQPIVQLAMIALVLFSFSATSMAPPRPLPPEGDVAISKRYTIKKSRADVFLLLDSLGFQYQIDSSEAYLTFGKEKSGFQHMLPDSLRYQKTEDRSFIKYYVLKNVSLKGSPVLKSISFDISRTYSGKRKPECIIRFYSLTFDQTPYRLDNWKKLRKLRKHYKKLIKSEIINELKE